MLAKRFLLLSILAAGVLFNACKKTDDPIKPSAAFTSSSTSVVVDEVIQFTNNSDNATSFKWSFGDGTTSTEVSPSKSYQTSAVFNVSLSSTGAGGTTISNATITVKPACSFTVENENALLNTTPVQFTNASKGASSYLWTFGDAAASTSSQQNPTFQYNTPGTYTVSLTAISAVGQTTVLKDIMVGGAPVVKELYFIEYGTGFINKMPVDGSGTVTPVLDINGKAGAGIAYDDVNSKIYFSDFEVTGTGNIWRCNLDGTNLEAIVSNLTDPYGIALDLAAGKVYWVDDLGNVSRANLDGSSQEIGLVNISGGQMRAISLDPANNKMYFYEVNLENLYVANLDGSNPTILFSGVYGYAILADS
ncbi:MAG: PKD domain-containing protein, partial [Saprospiraceae bacterium]